VKHTIRAEVMGVELEVGDKLSKFLYPDGLGTTNRTAADTLSPTQNDGKKRRRTSVSLALRIRDENRDLERRSSARGGGGGGGWRRLVITVR
jgi:hypothetical protein